MREAKMSKALLMMYLIPEYLARSTWTRLSPAASYVLILGPATSMSSGMKRSWVRQSSRSQDNCFVCALDMPPAATTAESGNSRTSLRSCW